MQGLWFDNNVQWVVGEGKTMKFQDDKWVGGDSLKDRFPRLYSISECKDRVIGEVGHWEDNVWLWDLTWRRSRFDWETTMEEQFLYVIHGQRFCKGRPDSWKWKREAEGESR